MNLKSVVICDNTSYGFCLSPNLYYRIQLKSPKVAQLPNLMCIVPKYYIATLQKRRKSRLFPILVDHEAKLYIPSTLNIDLILWHTQLIVCAEMLNQGSFQAYILTHTVNCMCVSLFKFHI